MMKLIAMSVVAAVVVLGAAPVVGQTAGKTELVSLGGASVEKMPLLHDFNAAWVIDTQNVLYRDNSRAYYLVTLKEACAPLENRSRSFDFFPGWTSLLQASRAYEVRPKDGERCSVAKIARLDNAKADPLRDAAMWRVW